MYEVGAGNGSFMADSLAYIRDTHPDIFARMKYRIIEISASLAKLQRKRAEEAGFGDVVEVINEDFFKWQGPSTSSAGTSSRAGADGNGKRAGASGNARAGSSSWGVADTAGEGCYVVALEVFVSWSNRILYQQQ